jgi:predicted nuclease of predicted toxin-antitoxin system
VSRALLLDEMLSPVIAEELREKGHDVTALLADPTAIGLPDGAVLARATAEERALVTRNIKDFVPLDAQRRATGNPHHGLVLISTRTFPEDRGAIPALIRSLDRFLTTGAVGPAEVVVLARD